MLSKEIGCRKRRSKWTNNSLLLRSQLKAIIHIAINKVENYQNVHGKTHSSAIDETVNDILGKLEVELDDWMVGEGNSKCNPVRWLTRG